jgi:phospholipase C
VKRGRVLRGSALWVGLLCSVLVALLVAPPAQAVVAVNHDARTPIKHLIFLMQSNHTFDNYFGTRPHVDGIPAGTCMPKLSTGAKFPCAKPRWIGRSASRDFGHTDTQFRREYNGGRMNGFVRANSDNGRDGSLAMGYYDDRDLPYYWNVADKFVLFDRFFSSAKSGSVPNRMFAVSGRSGGSNVVPTRGWGRLPTIFDKLQKAGVDWKFYIQNYDPAVTFRSRSRAKDADRAAQVVAAPLLGFARFVDDPELNKHIVDLSEYYRDLHRGTLPAVSYVVSSGSSEHPPTRIQAGQELVRSMINQLTTSSSWDSSAFMWSYDDWGGWYDHVPPPRIDRYGYGFRVPALLVSPYAKKGFVDHSTHDFTSVLAFIESNWGISPLAQRDRRAGDMMEAFDFTSPPRTAEIIGVQRHKSPPERLWTAPVYLLYGAAVVITVGAILLARRYGRPVGAIPAVSGASGVEPGS